MSYITFSDDVINTNNNETSFPELTRVFEEYFEIKVHKGSVLNHLNLQIFQSPLGFSVYQTDYITELVNDWFLTGKFRKSDTTFRTYPTYEK